MNDVMGIVLTEENDIILNELTEKRSVPAVPFGGRYRLIDFLLSNMVNSGIENVGITTRHNYSSLMDHLGNGAPWDLSRKRNGLFILPPYVGRQKFSESMGTIGIINGIKAYLARSTQKYVLIAQGHIVAKIDYEEIFKYHNEKNADVTIIYNKEKGDLSKTTTMLMDDDERVISIEVGSENPKSNNASMEMIIMSKDLLERIVSECMSRGETDLLMYALIKHLADLKIYGYEFKGYVGRINSVKAYYDVSMDLLNKEVSHELFGGHDKIYTKVSDTVPTKYGHDASVSNSLIADGCIIEGKVENCIIFRGAKIGKGAVVKNSIIMQNAVVYQDCDLENVVLDKEVKVTDGKRLIGQQTYPIIISKGIVV